MDLFERQHDRVLQIARSVRAGRVETLGCGRAGRHLLHGVADELGETAILVQVPRGLDKAAYLPLMVARQCGPGAVREVAACLARSPAEALAPLSEATRGRHLLVGGIDELRPHAMDGDISQLLESATQPVQRWLDEHAAVLQGLAHAGGERIHHETPRADPRWACDLLWHRVERDPDRYVLAVARQLLLDPSGDADKLRWDLESLVVELWDAMPSDLSDLVALLAAHRRPVLRADFEQLELVPSLVITTAIESFLVECRRGQLGLAAPWYERVPRLEADPRERHRQLADAFARRADEGADDAPLAILEAHRHYALIPDLPRARQLARFGVGALLDAAVRRSKERHYAEAAQAYDSVLELTSAEQPANLVVDPLIRAYALHYRDYNRLQGDPGALADTLRGYEESSRLWPKNALFWSHLIHARFLANEEDAAMKALAHAWQTVPPHPERQRTLVVKTVDRLLRDRLLLAAVFVWGDTEGETSLDQAVQRRLLRQLAAGALVDRVWGPGVPAVELSEPITVRVEEAVTGFRCVAGDLAATGSTRAEAMARLARRLSFESLAAKWYHDTAHLSILSVRFKHPAYQQILAMGRDVVPDLLRWIERRPGHFHHTLMAITGEHPLPAGERASLKEVCEAWLRWGQEHGYTW